MPTKDICGKFSLKAKLSFTESNLLDPKFWIKIEEALEYDIFQNVTYGELYGM